MKEEKLITILNTTDQRENEENFKKTCRILNDNTLHSVIVQKTKPKIPQK